MDPLTDTHSPPAGVGSPTGQVTALYQAYATGLVRMAMLMLADQQAAEDVVQDAFLGLYRRWGTLADPGKALIYVRSSVLNGCRTVVGLALSPDAGTLAVLYQSGQDSLAESSAGAQGAGGPFTLRTFSLATGKALRTWTAPEENISTVVPAGSDNEAGLTWTANGQTLAFMLPPGAWPDYERTLNVTAKGTNLLDDSRSVLAIPNPGQRDNCLSLLLASDGRTMVCGTETTTTRGCQQEPQFNLYSAATGKLTRVLYRYQGTCFSGEADVVWTGAGGIAVGVISAERTVNRRAGTDWEVGVLAAGKFTPLHVPMPTDYYDPGQLAF
jgi:hypothetical protein